MQRGRLLILVALVLIVLSAAGIFFILRFMQPAPPTTDGGTPVPSTGGNGQVVEQTATPASALNIIVAAQNLQRGDVIPTEALSSFPWPTQIVPPSAITDPSKVVGTRARYTIQRGEPIFSTMIVQSLAQISPSGSDGAGQIPPGFTAISVPYDKRNGVALGIQDGDYVNVLVSWAIVDIDQDFQSVLPNLTAGVINNEGSGSGGSNGVTVVNSQVGIVYGSGPQANAVGRVETEPNLNLPFYLVPQEEQRSRLVSQAVIQNALVLKIGDFGPARPEVIEPTPTAAPPDPNATATPPPPPTPTPLPPDIITLVVSPQDAIVLDFVNRLKAQYPSAVNMTLTLRSAGDTSLAETQSVTLQYMFERYTISLPAKLNYGLDGKSPAPTPAPATP